MEVQVLEDHKLSPSMEDNQSNVDTSRPFRSVKEAVAIFGERFLAREIYSPKDFTFSKQETPYYSPSPLVTHEIPPKYSTSPEKSSVDTDDSAVFDALKRLEAELEETKMEVKMLRERESETEVALASLNAELHKNMSKLALAEANAAGKAVAMATMKSKKYGEIEEMEVDEEKQRDLLRTTSTLAQILSIGEENGLFAEAQKRKDKKIMKKKPIIPLVGDLFSRKKGSSTTMHNPLFSYSLN
ncbi:hypothetical protein Leryth_011874 [Lithospermum erythrorhizon]|nr:hypothetical protein Leryth_011874 [Lithospermum erythrorhizon]